MNALEGYALSPIESREREKERKRSAHTQTVMTVDIRTTPAEASHGENGLQTEGNMLVKITEPCSFYASISQHPSLLLSSFLQTSLLPCHGRILQFR
jgi:hypothetical protein